MDNMAQKRNFAVTNNLNRKNNYILNQQISSPKTNNPTLKKNNFIQNRNSTNINTKNYNNQDEVSKALMIINREFKNKDNRIKELEQKIREMQSKIQSITNKNYSSKQNNEINYNINIPITSYKSKLGSVSPGGGIRGNIGIGSISGGKNNFGRSGNYSNSKNNVFNQENENNNYNYNCISDSKKITLKKFGSGDNLSHSNDTTLSYNIGKSSKSDVKNYLKIVKSRVDSATFKEFIQNIKLLTSKDYSKLNRNIIIEKVRILFGEENNDLFNQFENIIGIKADN